MSWWLVAINATLGEAFDTFDLQRIVPDGFAVFAFSLGTAVGAVAQRTIAAMPITLAGTRAPQRRCSCPPGRPRRIAANGMRRGC